ncbi:type VI secretion system tip protein VgrG [Marinobacter daepoensis]|uniref:type VI secretion system tip protein TssI/VgrG n=1 Tax=Marinobacter daepoensis TaxID=262077 RepID=UPI001C9530EE|nr:type VI secretion system tip protein TssI/VgrG [Marinobacter daepoensis]MBY6033912.1 type VI secretion system tip protein VgrG [Marinobacter daepoensis]
MHIGKGLQFTLSIGEQQVDLFTVFEFESREMLSEVFSLTITAFSRQSGITATDLLEQEAELSIFRDGELLRQFRGVVAEFGRGSAGHRRTCYYLTVRSPLWRLGLGRNSRISQHQSPEQIIRNLLEENGVTNTRFNLLRAPEEREYCVQYRESDLAFIQRLAAEEGWHYRAEHGSDGTELILADHHREALSLPSSLYNSTAGGSSRQSCVFAFDTLDRVSVAGVAMKDYTFTNPAYGLDRQEVAPDLSKQHPNYEHFDYPGRYKQDASGIW